MIFINGRQVEGLSLVYKYCSTKRAGTRWKGGGGVEGGEGCKVL